MCWRTFPLFKCSTLLVLSGAACTAILGSPVTNVSATADGVTCTQTGSTSASCSVGPFGPGDAASALATATWGSPGGRLEAISNGTGFSDTDSASVAFSGDLIITGATGSGTLTVQFSGDAMAYGADVTAASVTPISVNIGGTASSLTFPLGTPSTFTTTAPVSFGTPIPFSVSFSDTATGTTFHDGTRELDGEDAVIFFPTFVVTGSNGQPLGNVTVQLTPEPETLWLLACAIPILVVCVFRRRNGFRRADY